MTQDLALTPAASAAQVSDAIRAQVRTIVVTGPDIQGLLSAVSADIEIAPTMEIDSDDMALELQQMLGRLATVSAAIETERKERGVPLRDALQWLMDGYTPAKATVDGVIEEGKRKLIAWAEEQRRKRQEAARQEAERRQREAQAAAKIEAEQIAAAAASAATANKLRDEGSEQVAQALETQAQVQVDVARQAAAVASRAVYAAPVTPIGAKKVKGERETWKGRCTNKASLLQHIGERIAAGDLSLIDLVDVDQSAVNAIAKMQKDHLNVPGLQAFTMASVSVRKQGVEAA